MTYLLPDLLTETADRQPDAEAARFEGRSLTYGQLERLTNQLARTLHDAGVRKGDRVGIRVHKSLASIVGVFGVMKAGAIYVPLDPNAPPRRHAYITRNCDIRTLVASPEPRALDGLLTEATPIRTVVQIDDGERPGVLSEIQCITWREVLERDEQPPPVRPIDTDLAYILYTSGSTGDPKGVMISHRTILTFIDWCCATFRMGAADRVTSHAPLHFDLSTFDMYATVKAGGTVVFVPEPFSVYPVQLVDLLERERITLTYLVPSMLSLMVRYGDLGSHDLSALRAILFAGEVFPIRYLRELARAIPGAEYYNLYGPTETNVCTYYKVRPFDLDPERTQPVPIGIACENTDVFVVDDDAQLVTRPGDEGELWVRGACVAQGYWGDPERTARNFVVNPFQPHYRETAYRTGDIVTLADDGINWVYVGRRDHMVKSRGCRIELGDIEAALYTHPGVREAVVIAVPDELLGNRIKALVVPLDHNISRTELETHCRERLPRYMLPEDIDFREELPKTSTGKVDRALLARNADAAAARIP